MITAAATLVLGFDALGASAGGAAGFGVDADDLAELADDHKLASLVDEVDAGDLADLGVAFLLMTPLPPRDWSRYWSTSVPLPWPFSETERLSPNQIPKMGTPQK